MAQQESRRKRVKRRQRITWSHGTGKAVIIGEEPPERQAFGTVRHECAAH